MNWPSAITPTKTRPTTSIAVMTSLPSSAAVFASGSTTATMLTHPPTVGIEGALNRRREQLASPAELRRGLGPGLAVAREPVGTQLGAERDQRREVGHVLHASRLRDPDETVRVEIVAEQQRRVVVLGREEPGPPVVEQVALVDRLEPERVELFRQRRENGLTLLLVIGAERVAPEPALSRRLPRDRLPEVGGYNQAASSFVQ